MYHLFAFLLLNIDKLALIVIAFAKLAIKHALLLNPL